MASVMPWMSFLSSGNDGGQGSPALRFRISDKVVRAEPHATAHPAEFPGAFIEEIVAYESACVELLDDMRTIFVVREGGLQFLLPLSLRQVLRDHHSA